MLLDHLSEAMGNSVLASAALNDALHRAGKTETPADASELIAFAWAHLVSAVASMAGVRKATLFVEKLQRALEGAAGSSIPRFEAVPASPRPYAEESHTSEVRGIGAGLRAVLVDSDALDRAMLARSLVRTSMTLVVASSLEEMVSRHTEMRGVHVVKVAFEGPETRTHLAALHARSPGFGVVVRAASADAAREAIESIGIEFFEVLPARPSTSEAASSILTLARAVRDSR